MAAPKKYDYQREWENYKTAKRILSYDGIKLSQKDYAECLGLSEHGICDNFKAFRIKEDNEAITETLRKISRTGTRKVLEAVNTLQVSNLKEAKSLAAITYGAADRAGFSPQMSVINVTQQNVQALVIPPLFAGEEAQGVSKMMGE